ncbi:hypothetical protein [Bacillus toyonensis]|uniref:hypothetical protein n=1 Tax=Bacillus toyonensis TaxID=155322 RepID=UPI000BF41FEB|nr:hypothetical protein [Bacillus toyonensis]PGF05028.1 hypothetical protein COM61_00915 [Bacillus toyonensis]
MDGLQPKQRYLISDMGRFMQCVVKTARKGDNVIVCWMSPQDGFPQVSTCTWSDANLMVEQETWRIDRVLEEYDL